MRNQITITHTQSDVPFASLSQEEDALFAENKQKIQGIYVHLQYSCHEIMHLYMYILCGCIALTLLVIYLIFHRFFPIEKKKQPQILFQPRILENNRYFKFCCGSQEDNDEGVEEISKQVLQKSTFKQDLKQTRKLSFRSVFAAKSAGILLVNSSCAHFAYSKEF